MGSNCSPTLGDFDGDGDQDLITGNLSHAVRYFAHEGASWVEDASVLAGITAGQNAAPALADLDGDGDLDLTIGNYGGTFRRGFRGVSDKHSATSPSRSSRLFAHGSSKSRRMPRKPEDSESSTRRSLRHLFPRGC